MDNYREIAQIIVERNPSIVGVRGTQDDENYQVGDICRNSYEWDLENDCSTYHTTGAGATGTCATHIRYDTWNAEELAKEIERAVKINKGYSKKHQQVIIIGNQYNIDGCFDAGECRIVAAEVIAII